jgi:HAD superfamily hydrolase (TIGR01509 family)
MSIQAIILDVGDVILHEGDHAKRFEWEVRLGLAKGQLTRLVLDSGPAARAASGEVSERQVWQAVGNQLGLTESQTLALQHDFWACEEVDAAFVQFIAKLRPRYKIGILSNAWSEARSFHNAKFEFNTWVDVAVYSAEVKMLKPDPRIYELILAQLGRLNGEQCVFVDDKLVNVQAAQALGMKGVLCRETQQTINDIQDCLNSRLAASGHAK